MKKDTLEKMTSLKKDVFETETNLREKKDVPSPVKFQSIQTLKSPGKCDVSSPVTYYTVRHNICSPRRLANSLPVAVSVVPLQFLACPHVTQRGHAEPHVETWVENKNWGRI